MSFYKKFEIKCLEMMQEIQVEFLSLVKERLAAVFLGLEVDFLESSEKTLRVKILDISLLVSSPRGEAPTLICRFDISYENEAGVKIREKISPEKLDLPWDKVKLPDEFKLHILEKNILDVDSF